MRKQIGWCIAGSCCWMSLAIGWILGVACEEWVWVGEGCGLGTKDASIVVGTGCYTILSVVRSWMSVRIGYPAFFV